MERRRALIQKPTGSGAVRGVWLFDGELYAFRDNAGATLSGMFKATTAGWSAVSLGERINFQAGTAAFAEGET